MQQKKIKWYLPNRLGRVPIIQITLDQSFSTSERFSSFLSGVKIVVFPVRSSIIHINKLVRYDIRNGIAINCCRHPSKHRRRHRERIHHIQVHVHIHAVYVVSKYHRAIFKAHEISCRIVRLHLWAVNAVKNILVARVNSTLKIRVPEFNKSRQRQERVTTCLMLRSYSFHLVIS